MAVQKRTVRSLLAACAALALATALPASSQAATGKFYYTGTDGSNNLLVNPPDGICLDLTRISLGVDNQTDSKATLYTGSGVFRCQGTKEVVPAGTGVTWGTYRPNSVWFGAGAP
ncbi:hypothetical protein ABT390_38390 [Streptomyces aurantiacus]|uniref:Secreted protein n=1 Tax=Streptomyces aurantiacus JA 4570 TaxID=1286094 RepID=S4ANX5_9ACTN|nr:hypothetical protein [Streptomyces aurantiacus]EPH43142.1 hypothetical protein STRAU_3795 [Streptomyces aurantiacus JA 4570]